jgi:hypothetical protein
MSLVWFGDVWKRSGGKLTRTRRSNLRGAWPLLWSLQLISWLLAPLLWNSTPRSTAALLKRRGSSVTSWKHRPYYLRPAHMSSGGVTVTVNPRPDRATLVTIHDGVRTISVYGIGAALTHLEAHGLERNDPLLEWLWALRRLVNE